MLPFGKYQGRSIEELVLKEPHYIVWMLSRPNSTGPIAEACDEVRRLTGIFDSKPFMPRCIQQNCQNGSTRVSVYGQNILLVPWCDGCDPYSTGAAPGKLQMLRGYWDAVAHVRMCCNDRKSDLKDLILRLARAKNLPRTVGVTQAKAFFA